MNEPKYDCNLIDNNKVEIEYEFKIKINGQEAMTFSFDNNKLKKEVIMKVINSMIETSD